MENDKKKLHESHWHYENRTRNRMHRDYAFKEIPSTISKFKNLWLPSLDLSIITPNIRDNTHIDIH